jgi:hypothetical protein
MLVTPAARFTPAHHRPWFCYIWLHRMAAGRSRNGLGVRDVVRKTIGRASVWMCSSGLLSEREAAFGTYLLCVVMAWQGMVFVSVCFGVTNFVCQLRSAASPDRHRVGWVCLFTIKVPQFAACMHLLFDLVCVASTMVALLVCIWVWCVRGSTVSLSDHVTSRSGLITSIKGTTGYVTAAAAHGCCCSAHSIATTWHAYM